MSKIAIASVQLEVVHRNPKACLEKLLRWTEKAGREQAEIVVFPELIMSGGYALGEDFYDFAEPVPGPSTKALAAKAAELKLGIVAGMAELAENDVLYNSAVVIDKSGNILGTYRKSHVFPATEHIFSLGRELPVFEFEFGTVGIQICYDLEFPEPSRVLALKGATIILSPSAILEEPLGPELHAPANNFVSTIYSARALENRLPTVLSNRVGYDQDLKTGYAGLSRIVNSEGLTMVEAGRDEQMIVATLDFDEIRKKRQKYNYFRDRRPYLYSMVTESGSSILER